MTIAFGTRAAALAAIFGLFLTTFVGTSSAEPASADDGMRIFKSANCVGCHKWSGIGGGGYGGAAANLRQTQLTLEQIEETVRCGRPSTAMPNFDVNAYADGSCYGLKKADLPPGQMPPEPDHPLRPRDIQAVATYVVTHIKGKGEPDLAQCQAFFGTGTRVCDVYAKQQANGGANAPASSDAPASHRHATVETAADANAPNRASGQ